MTLRTRYIIDISNDLNTGKGDFVRAAFDKINKNFLQLSQIEGGGNEGGLQTSGAEEYEISEDLVLESNSKKIITIITLEDNLNVYLPNISAYETGSLVFNIRNQGYYDFVLYDDNENFIGPVYRENSRMIFKNE